MTRVYRILDRATGSTVAEYLDYQQATDALRNLEPGKTYYVPASLRNEWRYRIDIIEAR